MSAKYLSDYDPEEGLGSIKYNWGDKVLGFVELEHYTPIFAFDYLSFKQTKYCFDNPKLTTEDFIRLFKKKKEISNIKYTKLHDDYRYRFHNMNNCPSLKYLQNQLYEIAKESGCKRQFFNLPELYQFEIYTDDANGIGQRAIGFIGKSGVFYLVWLDYEHSAYSRAKIQ